jgi:tagatose-1,6-bisphosphate aldolase
MDESDFSGKRSAAAARAAPGVFCSRANWAGHIGSIRFNRLNGL